jgi:rod shape-determining protein MreB
MSFFSFLTQELAIDLGTANTLIIHKDKVVVDEPSIIAIERNTGNVIAIGKDAMQMFGKENEGIKTIRPLKDGVIADFQAAEHMIRGMIKMMNQKQRWISPQLKMVICIPSGITEVEKRAVKDSAERSGAKEVYLIHEPMAAAVGIGIDVTIAIIALGGIVCDESIRVAGDEFNLDILEYMRREHNLLIGERTAEKIKIHIGSALQELDSPPEDYAVFGRDLMTGIPKQIIVSYSEIARALDKSIMKVEEAVLRALEQSPPELSADILSNGIWLTGGGALLRGLDKRISAKTKLRVHIAEDPLRAVVRGTGTALKNIGRFKFLMTA